VNESTGFFTPEAFQQRHNVLLSLLMSSRTKKVVHDAKRVMRQFQGSKLSLANFDDIMVQSYVLNCGLHPHDLDALLEVHFPTANFLTLKSVTGSGKKKLALCDPRIVSEAAVFASSRVIAIKTIWNKLSKQLTSVASTQLLQLYETIERPLVSVLRGMEHHGVLISREDLEVLQRRYAEAIVKKAHEVQESCGAFDINIQSPSQIQRKLRELGLLDESVTSTDAKVLEQLGTHHPFPRKLLEYRALVKIQGTYVEGLLPHINPSTGRIHTTFQNALTNTGRLSSVHPNLQNIPVRTEEGREIRRCFMAPERWKLLSCDYSQVELRILAHISQDKVLQDAFRNNKDVHSITASQVFKVPESSVTKDLRRKAKAINFGIVYGMTEVGLSAQLDVSREEAAQYIRDYKNTYPGITEYMTQMQSHCSQHGYVSTMLGRRCHIPAIHDKRNRGMYNFALRAAINSPIQGTSADITKLAMLEVDRMFRSKQVRSRMILQIHDELMFECPDEEVDAVWPIIRQCMEGVGDRLQFSVPLTVGQSVSQRWEDK
jgi:DNA polymerase-1